MTDLAPIILFTFNRPKHTGKTLDALAKNYLAKASHLIIYSDGPRDNKDKEGIAQVRVLINSLAEKKMFKSVTVKESFENKGLAKSVISGVTEVFEQYEKVIVLEDDLVTSKDFLNYMNENLNKYKSNNSIAGVTGYNPLTEIPKSYNEDVYFSPRSSSLGWGTFRNVWSSIDWSAGAYSEFRKNYFVRLRFNRTGFDRSKRLDRQLNSESHSWSIIFGFNLFLMEKLFVYPVSSKLIHIGWDGSGTHYSSDTEKFNDKLNESSYPLRFPTSLKLNEAIMKGQKSLFGNSFRHKLVDFLSFIKYYN